MSPGKYDFKITLSDGFAQNVYELYLEVTENTPPYFTDDSTDTIIFKWNSGQHVFDLP